MGCLLFLVHVLAFHLIRGSLFDNLPRTLLFLYLSSCIWAFAFLTSILSDLEQDSPFIFKSSLPAMFLFSPFIYFWVKKCR